MQIYIIDFHILGNRYKSYTDVIKFILTSKGPKAFFTGIGPAMVRSFPANAATFFAYEMAMKAMA